MKRALKWTLSIFCLLSLLYAPLAVMATRQAKNMVVERLGEGARFSGVVMPIFHHALLVHPQVVSADESFQFSANFMLCIGPKDWVDALDGIRWHGIAWNVLLLDDTDTLTAGRIRVRGVDTLGIMAAQDEGVPLPAKIFNDLEADSVRISSRGDVAKLDSIYVLLGERGEFSKVQLSGGRIQQVSGEQAMFDSMEFFGFGWVDFARMIGFELAPSQEWLRELYIKNLVMQGGRGKMLSCTACSLNATENGRDMHLAGEGLVFRPQTDTTLREWLPDGVEGVVTMDLVHDLNARVLSVENLHAETTDMTVDVKGRFGNIPDFQNGNIQFLEPGAITLIDFTVSLQDHGFLREILEHRAGTQGVSMDRQADALLKATLGLEVFRDSQGRSRQAVEEEIKPFLENPEALSLAFTPAKPLPVVGLAAALFIQPGLVLPLLERGDLVVSRKMR